jgi:hypothetical protein
MKVCDLRLGESHRDKIARRQACLQFIRYHRRRLDEVLAPPVYTFVSVECALTSLGCGFLNPVAPSACGPTTSRGGGSRRR